MESEGSPPKGIYVNCGKCIPCRINNKEQWKIRMLHEMSYYDSGLFVTLTYDDDNVPINSYGLMVLSKDHIRNFIKRLRIKLDRNYDIKIKHYTVGEYGYTNGRPHYHSILMGLNYSYKEVIKDTWNYCRWEVHEDKCIGSVTSASIGYVADYQTKRLDVSYKEYNELYDVPEEFRLISNGIGKRYCLDNADELRKNLCIKYRGKEIPLPRYYMNLLGLKGDDYVEKVKESQVRNVSEKLDIELDYEQLYELDSSLLAKLLRLELKEAENKNVNISKVYDINRKKNKTRHF